MRDEAWFGIGMVASEELALTGVPVSLDTVGIAIPCRGGLKSGSTANGRSRVKLPGGGFLAVGIGDMAWIEASLPNRELGINVRGLELDDAKASIKRLVKEAEQFVQYSSAKTIEDKDGRRRSISPDDPRVVRLDLVRDFHLQNPDLLSPILNGLSQVPRNGRVKVRRFGDGKSGQAETLRVGPATWAATLYDKHVESRGHAEIGSLRSEFRLRSRQLASTEVTASTGSVIAVSDLSEVRCDTIRRIWFEKARFGAWVSEGRSVWDFLSKVDLSDREKIFFAGWLSAREADVKISLSIQTERRFRNLLATCHLEHEGSGVKKFRLNYETGNEEMAA